MGSRLWLYITQYEEKNNLLANLAEFIGSLKNIKKKTNIVLKCCLLSGGFSWQRLKLLNSEKTAARKFVVKSLSLFI